MKSVDITNLNFREINPTVHELYKMAKSTELLVDPYYELDSNRASFSIESLLFRGPVELIIVRRDGDNLHIICGHNFINSVVQFFDNEVSLTNLTFLKQFEGYKYSDFGRSYQRRMEERRIDIQVVSSHDENQNLAMTYINRLLDVFKK